MNKEELEQLKSTVKQWLFHTGSLDPTNYANELKVKFISNVLQSGVKMTKEELKPIDVSKYTVTENGNVIKDKLKQEARQRALEWNGEKINGKYNRPPIANWSCYEKGYLAAAEPREKRIAELEAQIEVIAKSKNLVINNQLEENNMLKEKIKQLEAQIEKMKNCRNCKNEKIEGACGHFSQVGWCKNWELAD